MIQYTIFIQKKKYLCENFCKGISKYDVSYKTVDELFPFNGAARLRREVVDHAADAGDFG